MRIEKLSGDRVRVTLTTADLVGLDVDIDKLKPNSKELHSFLFDIMETIKQETDFNPYNGQVVVEAMPSSEGICIVVSKISDKVETSEKKPKKIKKVKSVTPHIKTAEWQVFYIPDIDDLCEALTRIDSDALNESAVYKMEKGYCYILKSKKKYLASESILLEYSSGNTSGTLQKSFVEEHGKLIAEGNNLIAMKDGVKNLN